MKKVFYLGAVLLLMLWVHPSPLRAHAFGGDHHHGVADDPHWARLDEIAQYLDRHPEATLDDLSASYQKMLSTSFFPEALFLDERAYAAGNMFFYTCCGCCGLFYPFEWRYFMGDRCRVR